MNKKLFDYYTNFKISVSNNDLDNISLDTGKKLASLAGQDVTNGKKMRPQKDFNNISEYKYYLSCVKESALRLNLGLVVSDTAVNT